MDSTIKTTYTISIRLQSDGFSLYIYDSDTQLISKKKISISLFEQSESALIELFNKQTEILNTNISPTILIENTVYNLIPKDIFTSEHITDILNFQFDLEKGKYCFERNNIPNFSIELVFALPKALKSAIQAVWGNIDLTHHCTKFASSQQLLHENGLSVLQHADFIDILVLTDSKIQLLYSYPYQTDSDILYHILNVTNTLQISGLGKKVYLLTENSNPHLIELLKQHIDLIHTETLQNY